MELKEASEVVFTFGKHEGKTVWEVYEEHPNYLEWFLDTVTPTSASRRRCLEACAAILKRH